MPVDLGDRQAVIEAAKAHLRRQNLTCERLCRCLGYNPCGESGRSDKSSERKAIIVALAGAEGIYSQKEGGTTTYSLKPFEEQKRRVWQPAEVKVSKMQHFTPQQIRNEPQRGCVTDPVEIRNSVRGMQVKEVRKLLRGAIKRIPELAQPSRAQVALKAGVSVTFLDQKEYAAVRREIDAAIKQDLQRRERERLKARKAG